MIPNILSQDQNDDRKVRYLDFLEQIENDLSFLERVITDNEESWIIKRRHFGTLENIYIIIKYVSLVCLKKVVF